MAYKVRRRNLTPREREVVAARQRRREAYARSMGFKDLAEQARYRRSPKLRKMLKRLVEEWDYNSFSDLDAEQRRVAVGMTKYRNQHPKKDDWTDNRFLDYIQEVTKASDEEMEEWITAYAGG